MKKRHISLWIPNKEVAHVWAFVYENKYVWYENAFGTSKTWHGHMYSMRMVHYEDTAHIHLATMVERSRDPSPIIVDFSVVKAP